MGYSNNLPDDVSPNHPNFQEDAERPEDCECGEEVCECDTNDDYNEDDAAADAADAAYDEGGY